VVPLAEMPSYLPWRWSGSRRPAGSWDYRRVSSLYDWPDEGPGAGQLRRGWAPGTGRDLSGFRCAGRSSGEQPGLRMSVRDETTPPPVAGPTCIRGSTTASWVAPWTRGVWDDRVDLPGQAILARCRELAPELRGPPCSTHRGLRRRGSGAAGA